MSKDPDDESEDDIVQSGRVPARIVQTSMLDAFVLLLYPDELSSLAVHQFGLFKFRAGNNSAPTTPTSSLRSRAHIFGLDAISRNLFNSRPLSGSSKGAGGAGDFFGGSINGHKRSKTSRSRSSTVTQTTTTDGSFAKFSSRSRSNSIATTAATTVDDESSFWGSGKSSSSGSRSRARKLVKRGKSPGAGGSGSDRDPDRVSPRRSGSDERASSWERELEYSDVEDTDGVLHREMMRDLDESDMDLSMRLELARRNSQSQHGRQQVAPAVLEKPVEDTIYEGKT